MEFIKKLNLDDFDFSKRGVIAAYAFGSQITGHKTPLSDYDFAILFDYNLSENKREKARHDFFLHLTDVLKTDFIDVICLNEVKSPVLRYNAVIKGKPLYVGDLDQKIDFESFARKEYEDTAHIRKTAFYFMNQRIKQGVFGQKILVK